MRSCDILIVVCDISRIRTDKSVADFLQQYGKEFKNKIIVVATKSENIANPANTANNLRESNALSDDYGSLIQKLSAATKKRKLVNRRLNKGDKSVLSEKVRLDEEVDALESRTFTALVHSRSQSITNNFLSDKEAFIPEGSSIPIFPISNTHYLAHKGLLNVQNCLSTPEDTQIPDLRRYILEMAAPRVLNDFETYINHEVAVLLKGLDLWASNIKVRAPEELLKIVMRPQEELDSKIRGHLTQLENDAHERIIKTTVTQRDELAKHGVDTVQEWHEYAWYVIRRLARNDGRTSEDPPKKRKRAKVATTDSEEVDIVDWNKDLYQPAIPIITGKWEELKEAQKQFYLHLSDDLDKSVQEISDELLRLPETVALPCSKFLDVLRNQRRKIRHVIDMQWKEYKKGMRYVA
jgi:hypothetical protein